MIVRPATNADLPLINHIMDVCDLAGESVDYTRWDGLVLVAVRQSEIVGFVHVVPSRPYSIVTHIGVLPEHQKGRAASKLMESAELLLRSSGYSTWYTFAYEKETALRDLITRWGAKESPSMGHIYKRTL